MTDNQNPARIVVIDLSTLLLIASDAEKIVAQVVAEKEKELPPEILVAFSEGADVVLTFLRKFHETMVKNSEWRSIPVANTNIN